MSQVEVKIGLARLPMPPEPLWLKKELYELWRVGGVARSFGVKGSIGLGFLWSDAGLSRVLKPVGVSWPRFQALCGDHFYVIIDWLEGNILWESMCQVLVEQAIVPPQKQPAELKG